MLDLWLATLRSLRAHALRFTLTSLGIVWGAFMLVFLSATMEGFDRHFRAELEEVGPKIIFMGPGSILKNRVGERGARAVELEREDVDRIATLRAVEGASPSIELWSQVIRSGRRTKLLHVNGMSHEAAAIRNFAPQEGRFLSPLDVESAARVAFVGPRAAERLFGRAQAVGRTIQIESVRFRVVGVAEPKGEQLISSLNPDDLMVVIPYTTAQRQFTRQEQLWEIYFAPTDRELGGVAIGHTRELLSVHHDFSPQAHTALWFFNLYDVLKTIFGLLLALRLFLVSAGLITLMVGAVGVMNIMLVVVGERTQEIGLRKAVGASSGAIFRQFLAEAAAVCTLSGVLGAALGVGLTWLSKTLSPPGPFTEAPLLDPFTVSAIVGSLILVGLVAGLVPALRAARVPPAEALRAL